MNAPLNKLDAFGLRIGLIDPTKINDTGAGVIVAGEQKTLRALIERRHPEYACNKDHWKFLEDTYEGGREWFEEHIFRYIKEGDKEFNERKLRAYRFNHTREVVDLVNKHLFSQEIIRNKEDAPQVLKDFWKKSTRNGLGISDFARQISKESSKLGRIGVVIDNNAPAGAVTIADSKNGGVKIYGYIVLPTQLLDYSFDEIGELNWVLIQEHYREDADPFQEAPDVKERWRLWTKTEWFLFEEVVQGRKKKIVQADHGAHELGEVPVILHDNIISDEEWTSTALIDETAYLDRAVANYLSNLDAIIQDQTFSQLAMPAQGVMPGEDNYNKMLDMGTKRIFLYDGEGGSVPQYISPDVKQAQLIVTAIQKIINEIYHTIGLAGERTKEDNSLGIDNSSGVAKAYDFERVNALLSAKADSLEVTENKIARLVAKWSGQEITDDLVSYPDDFDTRGLYDEFDIAARLIMVEAPNEIRREQMRFVITKLFPMASKEVKARIESELKDWPIDPLDTAAAMMEITNSAAPIKNTTGQLKEQSKPKAKADNRQGQVTKNTP